MRRHQSQTFSKQVAGASASFARYQCIYRRLRVLVSRRLGSQISTAAVTRSSSIAFFVIPLRHDLDCGAAVLNGKGEP